MAFDRFFKDVKDFMFGEDKKQPQPAPFVIKNEKELKESVGALRAYARKLREEYEKEKDSWNPLSDVNIKLDKAKQLETLANTMVARFNVPNYEFNKNNFESLVNSFIKSSGAALFEQGTLSKALSKKSRTEQLINSILTEDFNDRVSELDLKIDNNDMKLERISTLKTTDISSSNPPSPKT